MQYYVRTKASARRLTRPRPAHCPSPPRKWKRRTAMQPRGEKVFSIPSTDARPLHTGERGKGQVRGGGGREKGALSLRIMHYKRRTEKIPASFYEIGTGQIERRRGNSKGVGRGKRKCAWEGRIRFLSSAKSFFLPSLPPSRHKTDSSEMDAVKSNLPSHLDRPTDRRVFFLAPSFSFSASPAPRTSRRCRQKKCTQD